MCPSGLKDCASRLKFEDGVTESDMECSCTLGKTALCYECMCISLVQFVMLPAVLQ